MSATASSGLPVSFSATGNCTVSGSTVTITGAGSCTITADQAGNANYLAAPSVPQSFSIAKATATITLSNLTQAYDGSPKNPIVATNPVGLEPGVGLSYGGTGSTTYGPTATAPTAAGTYSVTATLTNADYAATPVSQSFTITKASQTITFGPLASKTFGDAPFTVSATASSGLPVSFSASGNCTVSGSTVTITGAGSCTITADQAGNGNYLAAPSVPQTFAIAQLSQTIAFGPLAGKAFGDAPFTVSATASSGLAVTFSATGNCTVSGSTVTITGAGSCTITADQAGNANYLAAPSVTQSFSIASAYLRSTYIGDWFVPSGTSPTFRVSVSSMLASGAAGPTPDFATTPVTATFRVFLAGCGSTCSATPLWGPFTAPVSTAGVATIAGPSLADDAYIVTVDLSASGNYTAQRTVAAFAIHPGSSTYVVGGGNLNPQRDSTANDARGYFGFNIKKAKGSAVGNFAYSYRIRINTSTSTASNLITCGPLSSTCRDVDVVVRSTSLTSASTTQSSTLPITGTAIGKVTIQYLDAITAAPYTLAPSTNLTFRYDAYDAATGGANDKFGLTVYSTSGGKTTAYKVAAGSTIGQTGTGVPTTMALIAPVGDPSVNADISAPPGNR